MFYMGKILSVNKLTVSFIWKYSWLFRCVQYIGLFFSLCNLESACQVQLLARACKEDLEFVPEKYLERHAQGLKDAGSYKLAFRALVRRMLRKDPSFIL